MIIQSVPARTRVAFRFWAGLLAGCLLLSGCARTVKRPAQPQAADTSAQGSPQAVILAFLQALEENDVNRMSALATERVQPHVRDSDWRKLWSGYRLEELGEELAVEDPSPDGADKTVRVLAVYRHNKTGHSIKDSITVSFKNGSWFWDEF